jgi:hypothetical protein
MNQFLTRLNLVKMPLNGKRTVWRLDTPLMFRSYSKGRIHVGAGFETDFSGTEAFAVRIFTNSPTQASQIVYDYLCQEWLPVSVLNRVQAMIVFREAMQAEGVPAWRRWLVYWWMRIFN